MLPSAATVSENNIVYVLFDSVLSSGWPSQIGDLLPRSSKAKPVLK